MWLASPCKWVYKFLCRSEVCIHSFEIRKPQSMILSSTLTALYAWYVNCIFQYICMQLIYFTSPCLCYFALTVYCWIESAISRKDSWQNCNANTCRWWNMALGICHLQKSKSLHPQVPFVFLDFCIDVFWNFGLPCSHFDGCCRLCLCWGGFLQATLWCLHHT